MFLYLIQPRISSGRIHRGMTTWHINPSHWVTVIIGIAFSNSRLTIGFVGYTVFLHLLGLPPPSRSLISCWTSSVAITFFKDALTHEPAISDMLRNEEYFGRYIISPYSPKFTGFKWNSHCHTRECMVYRCTVTFQTLPWKSCQTCPMSCHRQNIIQWTNPIIGLSAKHRVTFLPRCSSMTRISLAPRIARPLDRKAGFQANPHASALSVSSMW